MSHRGWIFLPRRRNVNKVVRDEELQLRTETMKIDLFLSTWDTMSHRMARGWHAIRGHARSIMMEPRMGTTHSQTSTSTLINRSIVLQRLPTQGWGNGGRELWRGDRGTPNRFGRCTVYELSVWVSIRAFLRVI